MSEPKRMAVGRHADCPICLATDREAYPIDRDDWEEHYARDEWDQPPTEDLAIPEAEEEGS